MKHFQPEKKLLVKLACGHVVVLDKRAAAQAANGTTVCCAKCHFVDRRVVERSWVTGKENEP